MMTKNDAAKVYDTVLSIPSMNEPVRMDLKISRKNVLLLSHLIHHGLSTEKDNSILAESISAEDLNELKNIAQECLVKANLVELNLKLLSLSEDVKH
ncbi:hypothetical protein [Flavobacterium johnsoniae]|uniref:Uncharacterized protein n=1 Tax=Flavobacterium johnsoniae (strain ATCC 17061 / DSM 2064 / JCM 8514 / BCRC 14874 / CCUG 350202 / NBRC 14942 / NCIMB 11054 / UW101) TaxID=376686 RepID=A5FDZ6_FLAJ1|nr:hypothetical protein [Flavobacterium johnsoniae]ABQ06575.1 hypothetical protein Fjoh_3561 [Flavobacterium johnsoniae UW101]OXE99810.1 hypothetical protein B0A63_10940 [Flavobacterium johnsoniae UW101]WQG82325.1 hypothetical protein SR927_04240 [Flavobacterium johnsoniae UW101]SHK79994.1 hypothetical protein SAMN05444146_2312 [Flavobacterium johnsoniae]